MRRVQAGPILCILIGTTLFLAPMACGRASPSADASPSGTAAAPTPASSGGSAPSGPSSVAAVPAQIAGHMPPIQLTFVIDQITCGIDSILTDAGALDAPDGYRYCEADIDITNTGGGTTGTLRLIGSVMGDDGAPYGSDPHATDAAGATITTINGKSYGDARTPPIPVGRDAETAVVWQLPLGIAPAQMSLGGSGITAAGSSVALAGPVTLSPDAIGWRLPKGE